jgi:hypothetical protein
MLLVSPAQIKGTGTEANEGELFRMDVEGMVA